MANGRSRVVEIGMLTWVVFVLAGALSGIVLRLPGFALFMLAIVVVYGVWLAVTGTSWSGLILAIVTSAVAQQLGYFLSVLIRVAASPRRTAPKDPPLYSQTEQD